LCIRKNPIQIQNKLKPVWRKVAKSNYLRRINEKNDFALPGVPGRFLFFLLGGGGLGLGFVFVLCSLGSPAGREVDSEKGSPGIICILVKKGRKVCFLAK